MGEMTEFEKYWDTVPDGAFADDGVATLARVIAKQAWRAAIAAAEKACQHISDNNGYGTQEFDGGIVSGADQCVCAITALREP